jgi:predicted molibdopterin-dependent oxidoreductase YjgC
MLPGHAALDDDAARERFRRAWQCELARGPGLSAWQMLGRVRALYVMGDDVARSLPEAETTQAALDALDFLVVQDIFMSPAAALADVVLPAAAFAERDGTWTNLERRVQRIRRAVGPPGEAREDWQIIADVSRQMGKPLPYTSPEQIFEEIGEMVLAYAGMSYAALAAGGGLRPSAEAAEAAGVAPPPAEALAAGAGEAATSEQYPLLMAADPTLRPWDGEVTVCHTLTAAGEFTVIARDYPDGMLCVNPEDARRFEVRGGRAARVVSAKGEGQMQIRVTDEAPPGIALVPYDQAMRSGLMEITTEPATGRPVLAPTPISVGPVQ